MDETGRPDVTAQAPYGVNPANGRPYTKSPEERAAIGATLAQARREKAAARQAAAAAAAPDPEQAQPIDRSAPDREPGKGKPRRGRRGRPPADPDTKPEAPPPYKAGVIAKGMNRLYAKTGRILRELGAPGVGAAFIAVTRKESDDDTTVGEAWEELARVNTVWRVRLLKICTGGAAGQVFLAHLPILMALLMLEPVRKRVPFIRLADAVFGEDEAATPDGTAPMDLQAMMDMANQMMGPLLAQRATNGWTPRDPGLAAEQTFMAAASAAADQFDAGEAA